MTVQITRRLFSVKEYDQMITAGVFHEDDRIELLGGEIVTMTPIGIGHAACVKRLNHFLSRQLGDRVIISVQDPIHLDQQSEPEPDIAVLQPRADFYAGGHPEPEDIFLLVEVADSSFAYDREIKMPHFARVGIPEVWLVSVENETITVYRQPSPSGYTFEQTLRRGDTLALLAFPDVVVTAVDILG